MTAATASAPPETARFSRTTAYVDVAVVVAVLVGTNLVAHFTTTWASVATVPIAAAVLLVLMRRRGMAWSELGLSPRHLKKGTLYALAAVAAVTAVIAIGAALPFTRQFFLADRYATISGALVASMIVIPLQTVIPEELAFRGALHGSLQRLYGARGIFVAGSLLFGMWHIASSMGLTAGNAGLLSLFGGGVWGQVAGIGLAVIATSIAGVVFTWLRHHTGSLIAPIGLHWAVNGLGALAAATVWHLSLA